MRPLARISVLASLFVALGCGDQPNAPKGLQFAYVHPSCGPADGPAAEVWLTGDAAGEPFSVTRPFVRLYIQRPVDELPGQAISYEDLNAQFCSPDIEDGCPQAQEGRVSFRGARTDGRIEGTIDLRFGIVGWVNGGFVAERRDRHLLCG